MSTRTGPGTSKRPPLTPEQIAVRLDQLARGRMRSAQHRRQKIDMAALAEEVAGMPLDELRTKVSHRTWLVATLALGGYDHAQIARALGYATADVAKRALARPDVQRIVQLVRDVQLQKIIDGEFGVQAQAKAAAPKVTKRVIEYAGGIEDKHGRPVGQAERPADGIRAAETVLRLSGDLVDRKESVHLHWMKGMSDAELAQFANEGVWPEKYRHVLERLEAPDTIDGTP